MATLPIYANGTFRFETVVPVKNVDNKHIPVGNRNNLIKNSHGNSYYLYSESIFSRKTPEVMVPE